MKTLIATASTVVLTASFALAAGNHSGGHGHGHGHQDHKYEDHKDVQSAAEHGHMDGHDHGSDHMDMMEVGMPGDHGMVSRTVEVTMTETEDGEMLFEPGNFTFTEGETVRFRITNIGELDHEFVLDTIANNEQHRALMMKFPEMEHDDPNSVTLAPGESGEIIWTFSNPGAFQFACLIPGHMESGMHGPIRVASN